MTPAAAMKLESVVGRPARAAIENASTAGAVALRAATADDADALHGLIREHRDEGRLLPRDLADVRRRASRFVVYEADGEIKACAELAPLSAAVAEVRSLVVTRDFRRAGVAARLINEVRHRAEGAGFQTLCAFTHDARVFIRHNFSIVPHVWLSDKITADCLACPLFRRCGQYAMFLPLNRSRRHGTTDVETYRVAVA